MPEPPARGAGFADSASPPPLPRLPLGSGPASSRAPVAVQRTCAECEEELRRQPMERGQTAFPRGTEGPGPTPEVTPHLHAQVTRLQTGGRPLPASLRAFFEPRFGCDFSGVRIHTDAEAAASARSVRALAYTLGGDISFGPGQYAPASARGRKLLAHELTHVVQQSAGRAPVIRRQIDPCIFVEGKKVCGSDARSLCERIPSIPGCGGICRLFGCRKPDKKPECQPLPEHFKPGKKGGTFAGKCCVKNREESEETCCEKERMVLRGFFDDPGCCPPGQKADATRRRCVEKKPRERPPPRKGPCPADFEADLAFCDCPPARQNLLEGTCCPEGQHASLAGDCVPTAPPRPKGGKKPPRKVFPILFRIDRPQAWHRFADSVTPDGATTFTALVTRLRAEPDLRVELSAHASSDRPANDPDYNFRLTRRRVRLTARELLEGEKIAAERLSDDPDSPAKTCERLEAGQRSCGDTGASPAPEEKDRNVVGRTFEPDGSAP